MGSISGARSGGFGDSARQLARAASGLVWRADCLCCGRVVSPETELPAAGWGVGDQLCADCGAQLQRPWVREEPPVSVLPVFAAGTYGGPRRALIIALKERLRPMAFHVAARVLEAGVMHMVRQGSVPDPRWGQVVLLPAPSRRHAARARGGDVVSRICHLVAARHPGIAVVDVAYLDDVAADSVGLNRAQRRANVSANLRVDKTELQNLRRLLRAEPQAGAWRLPTQVLIVDDVCTTGATLSQFASVLRGRGVVVTAALVLAAA